METRTVANMSSTIAWIALLIAILALIVGWVAFNRASEVSLTDELWQETNQAVDDIRVGTARERAEARLIALRNDATLREDTTAYQNELRDIRSDLESAYTKSSAETRAGWEDLEADFDQLENQIRTGAAESLQTLQALIGDLAADVGTDTND